MTPTVTGLSNFSPVRPSYTTDLKSGLKPASLNASFISSSCAPSNTGVASLINLPSLAFDLASIIFCLKLSSIIVFSSCSRVFKLRHLYA